MVITEKSTVALKQFALMLEFDGDIKATRHALYSCTASRPKLGSSTKADKSEPNASGLTDMAVKTKTTTPATTPLRFKAQFGKDYFSEIIKLNKLSGFKEFPLFDVISQAQDLIAASIKSKKIERSNEMSDEVITTE